MNKFIRDYGKCYRAMLEGNWRKLFQVKVINEAFFMR
jgi:hypothetical protein